MNDSGLVRCGSCGSVNRVRRDGLGRGPRCGKCGGLLSVPDRPLDINAANFDREVIEWPGRVLVDFWSPTCGHCLRLMPLIDDIAREYAGAVKIVKINIMNERALAARFDVQAVPTLVLYDGGAKLKQTAGALPRDRLIAWMFSS